ncbi:MAG: hypothetical protein HWE14_10195 [Flavobacteriia bacterium]|nr:hypothetical protein [Flavobacteriia bacterium]
MKSFLIRALALSSFFASFATDCCCDSSNEEYYTSYATPQSITIYYNHGSGNGYNGNNGNKKRNTSNEYQIQSRSLVYWPGNVEVRLFDGWSNLNDHIASKGGLVSGTYSTSTPDCDTYHDYKVDPTSCTTPPTMLHLVVDSLGDNDASANPNGRLYYASGKNWLVSSIVDGNGADLTQDPDWECISDNEYFFTKSGSIEYSQGAIRCTDEPYREYVWVPFTVSAESPTDHENPGDITVSLNAGDYVEGFDDVTFVIIESDFDEIKASYTHTNGETGIITMVPQE